MKILYIHQYFNTPEMPGSTRSYEFAKRLVSQGNTVHLITSNWQNKSKDKFSKISGINVYWGSMKYSNKMNFVKRSVSFISFIFYVMKISYKLDLDLIIASSTPLTVAIPALFLKKIKKTKLIFEVRDVWPQLPIATGAIKSRFLIKILKKIESKVYRASERIIALSDGMKNEIQKIENKKDKIVVITNLCDIENFDINNNSGKKFRNEFLGIKDEPLIVYAGSFGRINNAAYLVEIAAESKKLNKNIKFLMTGHGYQKDIIISKSKKLNLLNDNLYVLDPMPKKNLPVLLSSATIITSLFIDLPEMENNSANKFFDGLAAGKPLMLNYGGWQSELIKKNGAGFTIPNHSAKKALKVIIKYISDKEKLSYMGKRSKKLSQSFSIEKNFSILQKTLNSLNI